MIGLTNITPPSKAKVATWGGMAWMGLFLRPMGTDFVYKASKAILLPLTKMRLQRKILI